MSGREEWTNSQRATTNIALLVLGDAVAVIVELGEERGQVVEIVAEVAREQILTGSHTCMHMYA